MGIEINDDREDGVKKEEESSVNKYLLIICFMALLANVLAIITNNPEFLSSIVGGVCTLLSLVLILWVLGCGIKKTGYGKEIYFALSVLIVIFLLYITTIDSG